MLQSECVVMDQTMFGNRLLNLNSKLRHISPKRIAGSFVMRDLVWFNPSRTFIRYTKYSWGYTLCLPTMLLYYKPCLVR